MKNSVKRYGEWALITGGSTGIGLEFAKQLAARGHNIVLAARNETRLNSAKADLQRAYKVDVRTIPIDLITDGAAETLADAVNDLPIGVVVLNAGMEVSGNFTRTPLMQQNALLRLNAEVPMQLAHLLGARLIEQGRGAIVFVSSPVWIPRRSACGRIRRLKSLCAFAWRSAQRRIKTLRR